MTMSCSEIRDLIHPFLDGELEVDKNVQMLKHFELCPGCETRKEAERKLQAVVAEAATEPVDSATRSRIMAAALTRSTSSRLDCVDVHDLVHPFLDGELEVDKNVEMLKHLEHCGPCKAHSEAERKLTATVVAAATEPVDEVTRARILNGAWARSEEAAGLHEGSRSGGRLRVFALAAGLLLAVTAGFLGYADPFCWGGCATKRLVEQTYLASLAVPIGQIGTVPAPKSPGVCVGCNQIAVLPGVAARPIWSYRCTKHKITCCSDTGVCVKYLQIPGGHAHFLALEEHTDGRRYFEETLRDGSRLVGWEDAQGVSACIAPSDTSTDALYFMATGIRNEQSAPNPM